MKAVKCIIICLVVSFLLSGGVCYAAAEENINVAGGDSIQLTQAEKDFIAEHPVIHMGVDPEFVPYEFIDSDGNYKGIAADYIQLISEKTGLQFIPEKGLTWAEAYEKGVEKELDVLPCVSKTAQREEYFLFSDPYYAFQRAVFVKEDNNTINSFDDLAGQTVAVQTNSSHQGFVLKHDSIELSLYPTVEEALQAVSNGTESAFVGNLATSSYLIKSNGITNLRYVPIMTDERDENQSLYFAIRDDWPELVGIINKALGSIGEEEKIAINNKWIGVQENVDYSTIIRIIGIVGAVVAIIFSVSFFWIFRLRQEIKKRKKTQEDLKAAKEESERANQIKSLFLARMSHEIRTPLNAIMGMSYLIKKTDLTATQNVYLEKMTQAARNMLGIINDILDFSKIEAGKIEIEKISFDLDKILQRVVNIISLKVEEQGIEFTMQKDPGMPTFFFGDPMRIEQIVLNVVNNAVKFTAKGSVSLSVQVVSKNVDNFLVEFCIRDTGIGMNPEQAERLFIPFDQGDSSINRRFGGTGLGLSIVKNLIDLMGGSIEVESVLNEGSLFRIRLPLDVDSGKKENATEKMAADCFRYVRALVLDQSVNFRTLLAECFHSFGIYADFASSEEEFLLHLAAKQDKIYNLLIVDFSTPKVGGIEFISRIKQESQSRQIKYMLMFPTTREDLFEEAAKAGIDFEITKPIIPSILYNGIIEVFNIKPPDMQTGSKKEDTLIAAYPYHILLVEDNKTNQFIAQSILEQAGLRVSKAEDGQQGYQLFIKNRHDIDLILMDIHMPVLDGYGASDLIRKVDANIPIVAMTADAIAGVEEKCKSHGIDYYVSKPFEPDQFIETILQVLKHKTDVIIENSVPKEADDGGGAVLDAADGIKRIGGDAELYRMVLQEYYEENKAVSDLLKEKIEEKNYSEAAQIVHKIKSSSGNIGARSLFEAASRLQISLQSGDEADILDRHKIFRVLLSALIKEIEKFLENSNC